MTRAPGPPAAPVVRPRTPVTDRGRCAANVGQTGDWLPGDRTDEDTSALLRAGRDRMRIEWGTRERGGYAGWLQVAGIDSGAGEVTVHLSYFDDGHDPARPAAAGAAGPATRRQRRRLIPHTPSGRGVPATAAAWSPRRRAPRSPAPG